MYQPPLWATMLVMISLPPPKIERQRSINDFWFCILDNLRATEQCQPIIYSSVAFMGTNPTDDIASTSSQCASKEHELFLAWYLGKSKGYGMAVTHNQLIDCHLWATMLVTISQSPPKSERQPSVTIFWSCIMDTQSAVHRCWPRIDALAASMGYNCIDDTATRS